MPVIKYTRRVTKCMMIITYVYNKIYAYDTCMIICVLEAFYSFTWMI